MRLTKILRTIHTTMKSALRLKEQEYSIKAPWGNIAALAWGDPSNPPVILCHGKLDASSGFRPLVSRLPTCFFYLSIDLPGNGKSDHLPKGVRYTVVDLVPTIVKVKDHFKWDKFIYIGHSLGVPIGKIFNIAYPGHITRVVELDPVPAHHTWPFTRQGLHDWYHSYYLMYNDERFHKFNSGLDTAPKYSYEKAQQLMMQTRGLSKEATEHVLERCLVPAGDGLYRFTFDQRMKEVSVFPFSGDMLRQIYTTTTTPTFCVIAKKMIELGVYEPVPFIMDEKAWPHGNYKYKIVEGGHDVHIDNPEYMADDISNFILEGAKAKL
ncbi:serine hydrolase-like protein [Spodoptera frugiperda]|uniref:Serine hydrolase-like protein n=1 Tax=Spodoptera frugiperda TaxID=7108 RepID=A0A9R0ER73_SPOFR|nr:serine hydrolase-like protein [Spodoptera frugiperda]